MNETKKKRHIYSSKEDEMLQVLNDMYKDLGKNKNEKIYQQMKLIPSFNVNIPDKKGMVDHMKRYMKKEDITDEMRNKILELQQTFGNQYSTIEKKLGNKLSQGQIRNVIRINKRKFSHLPIPVVDTNYLSSGDIYYDFDDGQNAMFDDY